MAFDGSTCPENQNSTDCLLRTLLQLLDDQRTAEDAETNWDPIAFYVTLVIGILAAVFTVITIAQAAVASGKGRRKANKAAIGDWVENRTKTWSLHELNLQYEVHTPLILIDTLVEALKKEENKPQSASPAEDEDSRRPDKNRPTHQPSSKATWVRFLRDFGLSKVVSPSNWDKMNLERVPADNLPDGVVAPAYAQVGVIVGTTLALGAHMQIQETGAGLKYPLIVGDGFQFEFVSYPILGMVGTYYRHGRAALPSTRSKEEMSMVITNMNYGRGVIEFVTAAPFNELQPESIDLLKDVDRLRIRQLLVQAKQQNKALRRPTPRLKSIADDYIPLISLFWAATPKFVPSLIPKTTLCMNFPYTIIALNGGFWSKLDLQKFSRTSVTAWPESVETPRWNRFEWTGFHATLGHGVHINESDDNRFKFERRLQRLRTMKQNFPARLERAQAKATDIEAAREAFLPEIEALYEAYMAKVEAAEAEGKSDHVKAEDAIADMTAETAQTTPDNTKSSYQDQKISVRSLAENARFQAKTSLGILHMKAVSECVQLRVETMEAEDEYQRIQSNLAALRMAQTERYERLITQGGDSDTDHPSINDYNALGANLDADKNEVDGHCVVLHMCIKLLQNPAELLSWFFSISPHDQKSIRSTILGQMSMADTWLTFQNGGLSDQRRAVLCNTTMALIQAEKATGKSNLGSRINSSLAPDGPSNESIEPERTDEYVEGDYLSRRHLNTLQYLQGVCESYGVDRETRQATRTLEYFGHRMTSKDEIHPNSNLLSIELLEERASRIQSKIPHLLGSPIFEDDDYENLHRLLERFSEISDTHLESKNEPWFQNKLVPDTGGIELQMRKVNERLTEFLSMEELKVAREKHMDTDDVIIYRCLLMALLFHTAQDSSEILRLGVWDQVVPII